MKCDLGDMRIFLFLALCINGFLRTIFVSCDCQYGYTGEYCEADILSHSGSESSGTEAEVETLPFTTFESITPGQQCINGVPTYHEKCICYFGYTGEKCDSQIEVSVDDIFHEEESDKRETEMSGNGKVDIEEDEASGSRQLYIEESFGTDHGTGKPTVEEDEMSGSAQEIIEEDETSGSRQLNIEDGSGTVNGAGKPTDEGWSYWSTTPMDKLRWELIPQRMHSEPSATPLHDGLIIRKKFAVVSFAIDGTDTELHMADEPDELNSVIFRFSFVPNKIGGKSRLELTTCFTRESDIIRQYKRIPEEADKLMKTSCPASHLPLDHMHTYEYEIFIAESDLSMDGKYIITQWHGSANPAILRDTKGCIAKVSMKDVHKLCTKGFCDQGEIFDSSDKFIGINYNQGGYPPLTMTLLNGHFIITARSDERLFIEKGGCSKSGTKSVRCPDHPRQQYHVLWSLSAKEFKFDEWVKFRWEIKWSEYDATGGNYTNPGRLVSNALIRVWMGGRMIVDWNGPCGRNDGDMTPYFKIGIYNPSGSQSPIRFFMRRYHHSHVPLSDIPDVALKNAARHLKKIPKEYKTINQNVLKSAKKYRFAVLSSSSLQQCTLHAERNYLSFLLSARFGKMIIDDYTKKVISHMIYELENQKLKIQALEHQLDRYENSFKSRPKRSPAYDEL